MGRVSGVDVLVHRSWLFVALLIAFLLAPRIDEVAPNLGGVLVYVAGLAFAVLLYLSVLAHEASHALMAQFFGMRVRSMTLHFLGGVTEIEGEAESPKREFWISVVGPLSSLAIGLAALGAAVITPDGLVRFAFESLAAANLVVGVLNMVPGLPLDGGKVLRSIVWAITGRPLVATTVSGWAGRVVAVLALGYPLLLPAIFDVQPTIIDFVIAAIIAMFLWTGASQALVVAKIRSKIPALRARELARRAVQVTADVPLAEALRQAREAQAGSIVVVTGNDRPLGIVNEPAVVAAPEDRRAWMSTGSVTTRLERGMTLPADITGETLVRAMQARPASEYLLVEPDGSIFGVLVTADVDAAFSQS
ncbi:MAG TPA: M50 family metallopeptidase [Nocardioidaceae bacterium]|nr:M50 family metallopeptidase [Nocardioidaceae bacterium]